MTYDKTFIRLEERLLDACDVRLQKLNDIGWIGDEPSIDAIEDGELRELAISLSKKGYTSVMSMLDNMIWTICKDLGVEKQLPGLYYDIVIESKLSEEWGFVPSIRLRAEYCTEESYNLIGVDCLCVLPPDISAKCFKTLDFVDRCYLSSHTLNKAGYRDIKPMNDYVIKHLRDYDVIITIDVNGNITYRHYDN